MEGDVVFDASVEEVDQYWKVDSSQIRQFLTQASLFNWRTGSGMVAKSVSLCHHEGHLLCRATDFDSYMEYSIKDMSDKPLDKTLVFPTATLLKVASLTSTFMIKLIEGCAYVQILGKWIPIEPINIDPSQYINSDPTKSVGEITLPDNLSRLYQMTSSALVPKDRNITFTTDMVHATLLWSTLQIPITSSLGISWVITSREAQFLKVFKTSVRLDVTISDIPRIVLSSDNCKLFLLYRNPDNAPDKISVPDSGVNVMWSSLNDLVSLSDTLPNSLGTLLFRYDNELSITYCSKLSNTEYSLQTTPVGTPSRLDESTIQCSMLKQIMRVHDTSVLFVSWDSHALYIRSGLAVSMILFQS